MISQHLGIATLKAYVNKMRIAIYKHSPPNIHICPEVFTNISKIENNHFCTFLRRKFQKCLYFEALTRPYLVTHLPVEDADEVAAAAA